jgi:biopolymer transport protein ExbD
MIKVKRKNKTAEVNSSSMADIAFLLFIFFLITTTITVFKGVELMMPPPKDDSEPPKPLEERNVFKVLINSQDNLLVENEPYELGKVKEYAKRFITNQGKDPLLSENPKKAILSLRVDRGTSYKVYVAVLNELEAAYHELYADYLNITVEEFLSLDLSKKSDQQKKRIANKKYPWNLSLAEPSQVK